MNIREQIITDYFQTWITKDDEPLKRIFSPDIVYREYYGPEYRGIDQVLRWFHAWNQEDEVLRWDIHRFLHDGDHVAVEWYFQCRCQGKVDGFDGVTLVDFNEDNRIVHLKEFYAKSQTEYPFGQ